MHGAHHIKTTIIERSGDWTFGRTVVKNDKGNVTSRDWSIHNVKAPTIHYFKTKAKAQAAWDRLRASLPREAEKEGGE